MTTLLVANRGEIAARIFATARRMGMRCVAVYSDADAEAPFVRDADAAIRLGPPAAAESYLDRERVVAAAKGAGADLVHPGYGFLAEDASFAEACERAGLRFVGPPSDVLAAMGDKALAKQIAVEAGAPVIEGYDGDDHDDEAFASAAARIGYPVLVKPVAGGGGKGMSVVASPDALAEALAAARRIAQAAFGDDRLMLERYLPSPRHVEVQVLADAHGNVIHLGERDCTIQRRHQKVLEEAPSVAIDEAVRARLCEAAVAIARRSGYRNAGTCEFLVGSDGTHGFIEMNARLQVEHPVTELVTGADLVELQLRVALGEELPITQPDVRTDGHAIEVRVYAEDPSEDFLPQAGRVLHLRWPEQARVDAGIEECTTVSTHYDPMLAKIVVSGPHRAEALTRLRRALSDTELLGVRTNLPFLRAVAGDPAVAESATTTTWLEDAYAGWSPPAVPPEPTSAPVAVAAAAEAARLSVRRTADPWSRLGPWRPGGDGSTLIVVRFGGKEIAVPLEGAGPYRIGDLTVAADEPRVWLVDGHRAVAVHDGEAWHVWALGAPWEVAAGPAPRMLEAAGATHLGSPLPGTVAAVRVSPGDEVSSGQPLVVVEAMKMEHVIRAPSDGRVAAVLCAPGEGVDRGQTLVDFESA